MSRINKLQERIEFLKLEIVHANRLDGWTLEGHKRELKKLIAELKEIQEKIDDKDNR